jgi:hypothetical protein
MSEATSAAVEEATCAECDSLMERDKPNSRTYTASKISYAMRCTSCDEYGVIHITGDGTTGDGSVDLSEYPPGSDTSDDEE